MANDKNTELIKQGERIIEKTKKKRNRPDLANFGEENVAPGENARYLRMARASVNLPPIDISDEKQVARRIDEYFCFCEENDRKPNMIGIANWLGVDATTLSSWKRGEYRASTHSPIIEKAVRILEELWVDYMQNGRTNPVSGIFLGKVLFGYRETSEIILTPNTNQDADPSTLAQAAGMLPEGSNDKE